MADLRILATKAAVNSFKNGEIPAHQLTETLSKDALEQLLEAMKPKKRLYALVFWDEEQWHRYPEDTVRPLVKLECRSRKEFLKRFETDDRLVEDLFRHVDELNAGRIVDSACVMGGFSEDHMEYLELYTPEQIEFAIKFLMKPGGLQRVMDVHKQGDVLMVVEVTKELKRFLPQLA